MFRYVYKGKTKDGNERLFFKKVDWIDNTLVYYVDIKTGIIYFENSILMDTLVVYVIKDLDLESYKHNKGITLIKKNK